MDTCGGMIPSKRGLLASLWSLVTLVTAIAFVVALTFTLSDYHNNNNNNNNNNNGDGDYYNNGNYYNNNENDRHDDDERQQPTMALTSRALIIAALWTAALAILMAVFGTVILGWQSPTTIYYTCCSPAVHTTSPLALGTLIGGLLMFANLTLVCSVVFGEFPIRDFDMAVGGGGDHNEANNNKNNYTRGLPSRPFSILCACLTMLYAGFAVVVYYYSPIVLAELHNAGDGEHNNNDTNGFRKQNSKASSAAYMAERFDSTMRRNTFVAPSPPVVGTPGGGTMA